MGFKNITEASSLFSTQDVISCAPDTEANSAYIFQWPGNSNNHEIIQRILIVSYYPILRTLRFPEIRTCEVTDEELGRVNNMY